MRKLLVLGAVIRNDPHLLICLQGRDDPCVRIGAEGIRTSNLRSAGIRARFAAPLVMQGLERVAFGLRRPKGNGAGGNPLQKIRKQIKVAP